MIITYVLQTLKSLLCNHIAADKYSTEGFVTLESELTQAASIWLKSAVQSCCKSHYFFFIIMTEIMNWVTEWRTCSFILVFEAVFIFLFFLGTAAVKISGNNPLSTGGTVRFSFFFVLCYTSRF